MMHMKRSHYWMTIQFLEIREESMRSLPFFGRAPSIAVSERDWYQMKEIIDAAPIYLKNIP